jgi:hypothetical protein
MSSDSLSPPPLVYSLSDVAGIRLPCTVRWLADKLRSGQFVGHKIGRIWVLTEDDIEENLRRCAVTSKSAPLVDSTIHDVPQFGSMTRTTLRRMCREGGS